MTRYALEKALKLSEVLIKEVTRLDGIVKNYELKDKLAKDNKENYEDDSGMISSPNKLEISL